MCLDPVMPLQWCAGNICTWTQEACARKVMAALFVTENTGDNPDAFSEGECINKLWAYSYS